MYYQGETDKKERRKIIAISTAAVVVILILIVAIIVAATKNTTRTVSVTSEASNTEVKVDENKDTEGEANEPGRAEEAKTDEINSEDTQKEGSAQTVGTLSTNTEKSPEKNNTYKPATNTVAKSDNMPNTGPEEFLPLALMAGMLVAYISSRVLAKRSV